MAKETSGAVAADRLVRALFGAKPAKVYRVHRDHPRYAGQYSVFECEERDGALAETGRAWTAPDIVTARGFVPLVNRVQVHPDPAHDEATLVESWV